MGFLKKAVVATLFTVFSISILWGVFIHINYAYTKPRLPQPETGRIHRITVNHGYVVYVTEGELRRAHFVLNDVFWVGMASFVVLGFIRVYWPEKTAPRRDRI
jgi:hypothetical protein